MLHSLIHLFWRIWKQWLEKRHAAELERLQTRLNQAQWRNSLAEKTHEADLAAGYNIGHFNTMQ